MSRALAIFMVLASLIVANYAATVNINVGEGGLKFVPQNVTANMGDMLVWKWVGGSHNVMQSDAPAGSCTKSAQPNAFASATQTTGTFNTTINQATGKMWFFCGVPGHCQAGMWGVVTIGAAAAPGGGTPASPASPSGASSSSGASPTSGASTSSGSDTPSTTSGSSATPSHSAAGRSTTSIAAVTAGVLASSLLMAVLLL